MTTCLGKSCSFGLPRVLFGFESRIWDLIVSIPDHCLSFDFVQMILTIFKAWSNLFPNASTWLTVYTAYSHVIPSLF